MCVCAFVCGGLFVWVSENCFLYFPVVLVKQKVFIYAYGKYPMKFDIESVTVSFCPDDCIFIAKLG